MTWTSCSDITGHAVAAPAPFVAGDSTSGLKITRQTLHATACLRPPQALPTTRAICKIFLARHQGSVTVFVFKMKGDPAAKRMRHFWQSLHYTTDFFVSRPLWTFSIISWSPPPLALNAVFQWPLIFSDDQKVVNVNEKTSKDKNQTCFITVDKYILKR